jgi:hypothetical protein
MTRTLRSVVAVATVVALAQASASAQGVYLNEIYASHSGTDTFEYIELKGPAGMVLDNFFVCIVEGEGSATNQGTLDHAWDLTGYTIPASGFFMLATNGTPHDYHIVNGNSSTLPEQDAIENGTETFYLVDCGNATNSAALQASEHTDIDPDGDNITTIPTLGTIVDIIGMTDDALVGSSPANDNLMDGAQLTVSPSNQFPAGIFRCHDAPNPWCPDFLAFDPIVNLVPVPRTPGAPNNDCPTVPCASGNPPVNYCTAGTTTNGCNATMSATGTPSLAASSGFTVSVSNVEGAKTGIIFYGASGPVATPWGLGGSSYLCVKAPTQRSATQSTGGTNGACDGSMSLDLMAYLSANTGAIGGSTSASPFLAGQKAWLQGWFRDPPAVKTTSLSDGLEITFVP